VDALRLNRQYPPWEALRAHLDALAVRPPGEETLSRCPRTGWPVPAEWLRVRVDHRLAPEMLARIHHMEKAGDEPSRKKGDYLRAMAAAHPLPDGDLHVALIRREPDGVRFQVVLDRWEVGRPAFVRWTIRLLDRGVRAFDADEMASHVHESFKRRLLALASQPVPEALVLLRAHDDLVVDEMARGEVGPVLDATTGPVVSAGLGRASPAIQGVAVDDPLQDEMHVPGQDAGFGYTFQRKWAVPEAEVAGHQAWLRKVGSKGMVYGYAAVALPHGSV